MANPTNKDIFAAVGNIQKTQAEQGEMIKDVRAQAIKTNGRVTELERQLYIREGYEKAKSERKNDRRFDLTTAISILVAIAALVGALWWIPELIKHLSGK